VLLEVPFRRVAETDAARLEAIVHERLAPVFEPADAPLWQIVAERSRFIGETERPADIGFRKMHPKGYAQLCVVNDEIPFSPWARPIPHEVLSKNDQDALVAQYQSLLEGLYGEGVIHFLVFAVLAPGGEVPRHRDMPHDQNKKAYSHHFHVPITGAAEAEFVLRDEKVFLERGGLYEIDNLSWHSTTNHGAGHRVNLMIDYCPLANLSARNAPSPGRQI
jgi:hypothetical protein